MTPIDVMNAITRDGLLGGKVEPAGRLPSLTFVSCAQNFEDVMLYRPLRHVDRGFYIDVGAQDPVLDSVTKAFYDLGWRGIDIEPVPYWFERLETERLGDINLQVATSDRQSSLTLYEVVGTGLLTIDGVIARNHAKMGFEVRLREMQCTTLDAICAEFHINVVHFLKVDAEGAEESVLRGMDLSRIRPWIVLVEAMEPNSTIPTHRRWEPLLLTRGYVHVHFDGLNRFYLAREHEELRERFVAPPTCLTTSSGQGRRRPSGSWGSSASECAAWRPCWPRLRRAGKSSRPVCGRPAIALRPWSASSRKHLHTRCTGGAWRRD
jgi:FkbM family methyltransferase